ncbi:hypothetical protein EDB92DRAFT_1942399 [Lactarius akahatsu]|uniref:BTB domain-containing protein n=1 Tax=Lactarius akahatsu TaxID=416441 RepID=A0AAD4QDJ1_9AGAM|nr:hypothetical protein EDB92DRAFT_1942399 [Lactarius akahatsu]
MPIPSSPSPTTVPVTRHRSYFIHEADVTFKVEDYVFRVHKYFFTRESSYFRRLFEPSQFLVQDPPGSSEANPIILEGISSDAFACFLWVFYNPKYSIYDATPGQWSSILGLAQKWGFRDVELLCIRELEKLDLSPVDRIHIYQRFGLDTTLLIDSYATLTTREEPIGLEEGVKLGLRTSLQIARAREMSRGPDTGVGPLTPSPVQLDAPKLHGLLSEIFGLPKIITNGGAQAGPFTCPDGSSDKLDRASNLPATAPTTPFKAEALSQSTSTSEAHPPTTDNTKLPPLKTEDTPKQSTQSARNRNKSSTSRSPFSWQF